MPAPFLKTSDIARELGVHPNTIRIYEAQGFLPHIPRDPNNGYRQFKQMHLEQARLIRLVLHWPYLVSFKSELERLVLYAVDLNFDMAIEIAYDYLTKIRIERTNGESAIDYLERWAAGYINESNTARMHISETASYLDLSVDMLRNWERSGLIEVPRDPSNAYRLYGTREFGRLRVIRLLIQSGHSLMAILRMLQRFDAGYTTDLASALNMPLEESANEAIEVIADRWIESLFDLEERAQASIQQIRKMIEMKHTQ